MKLWTWLNCVGLNWPKVGPKLSPETKRRVELLFRPEDQPAVIGLLDLRCGYSIPGFKRGSEVDVERVRFAALKMSNGNVTELRKAVDLAHTDFRDLLMNTGFGNLTDHQRWLPEKRW